MPDTITIPKANLQLLLELISKIEEDVEYVSIHLENHPYECIEQCREITKMLNKIRGILMKLL